MGFRLWQLMDDVVRVCLLRAFRLGSFSGTDPFLHTLYSFFLIYQFSIKPRLIFFRYFSGIFRYFSGIFRYFLGIFRYFFLLFNILYLVWAALLLAFHGSILLRTRFFRFRTFSTSCRSPTNRQV